MLQFLAGRPTRPTIPLPFCPSFVYTLQTLFTLSSVSSVYSPDGRTEGKARNEIAFLPSCLFSRSLAIAIAMLFDGLVFRLDLGDDDDGHEVNLLGERPN